MSNSTKKDQISPESKRQLSLENFQSQHRPSLKNSTLPIECYECKCIYCGSPKIIKKEYRERNQKEDALRYLCKNCGRKFTLDPTRGSHYPLWVHGRVLDLAIENLSLTDIIEKVEREAGIRNSQLSLSRPTVQNLIEYNIPKLEEFERLSPKVQSGNTWQIDDMRQPLYKKGGDNRVSWVTNVLDEGTRYWISACVSPAINESNESSKCETEKARSGSVSKEAIVDGLDRGFTRPEQVKCDGHGGHKKGVKQVLPTTDINSKTKDEDFAHINQIERLHKTIRKTVPKSKKKFRSAESLRFRIKLLRQYYNFLRDHNSLEGETPAQAVGIETPDFNGFEDLIKYAHKIVIAFKERKGN